jgi:hypothetical protein
MLSARRAKRGKTSAPETTGEASASADSENSYSDQLFGEEQPVTPIHVKRDGKARKSEPARVSKTDEYDEDVGRMESQ